MEEIFWKIWYRDDVIVLAYSVMMTIAALMPFFGKEAGKAPEPLPGKETDGVPEPMPGKGTDKVTKPHLGKWTGKIEYLKKIVVLFVISGVLVGVPYLYINNVNAAERHYKNGLRFLNGEDGFSINYDIAMTAFERAGECGHAQAYRYLGEMKMAHDDDFAAVDAWGKAVRMGDVASARLLGEFYETTSVELPATRKKELVYISYYLGGCLGDEELRRKADRLRFVVSPKTREDAASLCAEIAGNGSR